MTDPSATSKPRTPESPPRDRREILHRWLLASGCFAVLLVFFSPPWGAFLIWSRVPEMGWMAAVRRGGSVLLQVENPGVAIPDGLHGAIQWRLLFPVIGHVLNLPPPVLFALAHVGCIAVFAFVITVLRRRGVGFSAAGIVALIIGAGSWFFASVSWLGYFDSWLVFALLVVAFSEKRWTLWAAFAWAPWIDERFVIAAPLALLCRFIAQTRDEADAKMAFAWWRRELPVPVAALSAFLVVRLGFLTGHSVSNATVGGYMSWLHVRSAPISQFVFGIWEGLRAGWLLVIAALWFLRGIRWRAIALGSMTVAVMLVALFTAQDFSRSMMFVLPVAVLGAARLLETRPRWLPWTARGAMAAALLLPAHLVMSDGATRIFYLYHELDALEHPPSALSADLYEVRANRAVQDSKFAEADSYFSLAIKLSSEPAALLKQRGILRAAQQNWKDAREDFALMVQYAPENPEGWFLRAQANLALGDATAAREDMKHAVSITSHDWTTRPDVARFLAKLNQAR